MMSDGGWIAHVITTLRVRCGSSFLVSCANTIFEDCNAEFASWVPNMGDSKKGTAYSTYMRGCTKRFQYEKNGHWNGL